MSESLNFIKDSLVGHKLKIDRDEYERLYEIGKEAQIFFSDEIKRIWENEGLDCLKTDLDSGRNKRIQIFYNPDANFDFFEYELEFATTNEDLNPAEYFPVLMNKVIEQIIWGDVDKGPMMPYMYDLNAEKDRQKNSGIILPNNIQDSYWLYNLEFTIGNFVYYTNVKQEFRLQKALVDIYKKDIESPLPVGSQRTMEADDKVPTRFVVMLPIKLKYVKRLTV